MKSMTQTELRRQPALLERVQGRIVGIGRIDEGAVLDAYRRWAPIYDYTFGRIAREGRRHAVELINEGDGRVLEVGVGTGLSLPDYDRRLEIVGIDLSPDMLEKARERVASEALGNVTGLHEMDAADLKFPDAAFDTVVAMYVMTVVPEPEVVMRELA
ncbi:MAG: class I SAM-dependent methyltransferase, partial [Hyphomicrobium sp.]